MILENCRWRDFADPAARRPVWTALHHPKSSRYMREEESSAGEGTPRPRAAALRAQAVHKEEAAPHGALRSVQQRLRAARYRGVLQRVTPWCL